MTARTLRRRARRPDEGASVVEFALVAPLLFLVLFGIIDYGIWFSDSISARQAVRDAARRGVVEDFTGCPTATPTDDMGNLACSLRANMGQIAGNSYIKIMVTSAPGATGSIPWATGKTLRVCTITQHDPLMPLVPFPAGGLSQTKVDMPIEQAGSTANSRGTYTDPSLPPGGNWNWCQ